MTKRAIPGEPRFCLRTIRFPEDEVSLYVRWTQFYLLWALRDQKLAEQMYRDAFTWCADQFGMSGQRWMIHREQTFCFQSDVDSTAFRLRWC